MSAVVDKRPANELAQLARVWRLGNRAFKAAFEDLPADPETHHKAFKLKPEFLNLETGEAEDLRQTVEDCDGAELAKASQAFAIEKTARYARFQLILCMGDALVQREDEARAATETILEEARVKEITGTPA